MSIEGIESILSRNITKGKKLINIESTNLVGPGENFGGELLKLEITTEDESTKSKDVLHAVAKKIPVLELFQTIFDIQKTFRSEILFYEKLVPIFQNFQKENNVENVINCFGEFYGARINLNGSDIVDRDAVILMENLTYSGYKNVDRFVSYNLEEAEIVLKELAKLHAVALAIKLKKPDFFEKEIKPVLNNDIHDPEEDFFKVLGPIIEEVLWESDKCVPFIPKVKKIMAASKTIAKNYQPREPFATFCHWDFWINNTMMKHENGKPISCKLVDFQVYNYKSPAVDVLKFMLTSVQTEVLKEEFDNLLVVYHTEFVGNLKKLGCDIEPFSYSKFEDELAKDGQLVFAWHLFFLIFVVFGPKEQPQEGANGEFEWDVNQQTELIRKSLVTPAKEKLQFNVEYLAKKNWI